MNTDICVHNEVAGFYAVAVWCRAKIFEFTFTEIELTSQSPKRIRVYFDEIEVTLCLRN